METCDVTYYAPCSKYDLPALLDYIARMLNSLNKTCVYNRFSNEVIGRLLESAIEKEDYKFCKRIREYMKDRHPATGEILDYELFYRHIRTQKNGVQIRNTPCNRF